MLTENPETVTVTDDTLISDDTLVIDNALITDMIGSRLRSLREQRQMSMLDLETLSGGDLGPSTVGAYERGERVISLPRLNRLAEFYGVPIEHLIPTSTVDLHAMRASPITERLSISLERIGQLSGEPFLSLIRFIDLIRQQRNDPTHDLITLRGADAVVVAAMLGVEVGAVVDRLSALDLLATTS